MAEPKEKKKNTAAEMREKFETLYSEMVNANNVFKKSIENITQLNFLSFG